MTSVCHSHPHADLVQLGPPCMLYAQTITLNPHGLQPQEPVWAQGNVGGLVPASLRGTYSTVFAQLARKTRYPGIWRAGRRGGRLREASRRGRVAGRGRRSPLVSYRPPITSQQVLIYHHKASWFVGALVLRLLVVRHNGLARPLSWCFSPLVYVPRECCTK